MRNDCKIYPKFDTEYDERMFGAELQYWGIQDNEESPSAANAESLKRSETPEQEHEEPVGILWPSAVAA